MPTYDIDTVTVGELLDDPKARAVLERIEPGITANPMISFARSMTVSSALAMAGDRVDAAKKQRLLTELAHL